jgi:hypothetical protein
MLNRCEIQATAQAGGRFYDLNKISGNWILTDVDGLGMTDTRRLSQRGPIQDGDTDLGWRREPRLIALRWALQGCNARHLWDLRTELMTIWRPRISDPVILNFYLPNGDIRAADVNLEGELDFKSGQRLDGRTQAVVVPLKASDPRLYDPTLRIFEFNLLGTTGGLPIPWTIPIPIGAGALNTTGTLYYAEGHLLASAEYPVIIINGPITDPVIENLTTGEQIALTANGGLALSSTEFVTIDLTGRPLNDRKTIIDGNGNSVSQYLTTDSDLATWHLAYAGEKLPDGTYADGNNVIRVTGTNANLLSRITLRYYDRYEGV